MADAQVQGCTPEPRCVAALAPQTAIDAAVLAASKPTHDDGHTDCYYAGILLAAWPFLNAADTVPREVAERLAEALDAVRQCAVDLQRKDSTHAQWIALDLHRLVDASALAEFRAVFPKAEEGG